MSPAEFLSEVESDQAHEKRLLWSQMGILLLIAALACLREWINS